MEVTINKKRILWLDIAKGIAMLLVVFGHVVRGGAAQRAVYGFHVPAFFLLSGMSVNFSKHKSFQTKVKTDVIRIMLPYYIWGLLSIAIYLALGHIAQDKLGVDADMTLKNSLYGLIFASSRTHYMRYNLPLWFLPCLFATKILFYLLQRLFRNRNAYIFAASGILCVLGFIYTGLALPCLPFALEISVKLLPFFALGCWIMDMENIQSRVLVKGVRALLLGIVLIAGAMVIAVCNGRVNYSSDFFTNPPLYAVGALIGCSGVVLFSAGIGNCRWLSCIGRNTLGILVMHKFAVMFFQIFGPFSAMLENKDTVVAILTGVAVSGISVGMCLLAVWVLRKICPFVLGEKRQKVSKIN